MKNKEKYFNEILEAFNSDDVCSFKINFIRKKNCIGVSCGECHEIIRQWLEEEYKEPINPTRNERAILESVPKEYKWIARDENNELEIYEDKPEKVNNGWIGSKSIDVSLFNNLFQFIKWEDEEPYLISEIIKNCEISD